MGRLVKDQLVDLPDKEAEYYLRTGLAVKEEKKTEVPAKKIDTEIVSRETKIDVQATKRKYKKMRDYIHED